MPESAALPSKTRPKPLPRTIGVGLVLYGLLAVVLAAGFLLSEPPSESPFVAIPRSLAWLDIAFGLAVLLLGAGMALGQRWTSGTDWVACVVIALLVPARFDPITQALGTIGLTEAVPWPAIAILVMALLLGGAYVLYRHGHPALAPSPGVRYEPPRVTFVSRALAVLLILAGVTRLWLLRSSARICSIKCGERSNPAGRAR